jgi:diguanylate cyclase (GGDEF)-like protein/PAS domain S-box-containing protein
MAPLTDEHQDLLQLLYMAPVGLIMTNLEGGIAMANSVAAKLLMPLSQDGEMNNLFTVLEQVAPDVRVQAARFTLSQGSIFESMEIHVASSDSGRLHPKTLSLKLTKIDEASLYASLSDVTEERRMISQIAESEARLRALFDAALDAIISMDDQGCITDWNQQAETIFGWSKDEVMGRLLHETIAPECDKATQEVGLGRFLQTVQSQILSQRVESTALRRSGLEFPVSLSIFPFKHYGVHYFTAFFSDRTERKRVDKLMHQLAHHDSLTGLANRTLLNDRLTQSILTSKRSMRCGALMILDLDNFKPVNDLYGHLVGDLLLVEVARRLKSCVREVDTVSRFGGDEFVVLLSELDASQSLSLEQAMIVAEKIRTSLSTPYKFALPRTADPDFAVEHHCSASIGVAMFMGHQASQTALLKAADAAMYQAKNAGRNAIRVTDVEY